LSAYNARFSTPQLDLQSGTIEAGLAGSTPIIKSTDGTVYIDVPQSARPVTITGGNLYLRGFDAYFSTDQQGTQILGGTLTLGTSGILTGGINYGAMAVFNAFGPSGSLTYAPSFSSIAPGAKMTISQFCYVTGIVDAFTDAADQTRHLNIELSGNGYLRVKAGTHNGGFLSTTGQNVTIDPGATLTVAGFDMGGNNYLSVAGTLRIRPSAPGATAPIFRDTPVSATGVLDITNNAVVIQSTGVFKKTRLDQLRPLVASGYSGGNWTGMGITSSTAAANSGNLAVALADNADLHYTIFHGQTVNDSALLIALATIGDANLDGKVDAFDLNLLAAHWQQPADALWSAGDFTYDGKVDAFDLNQLAAHWQMSTGNLQAALAQYPALAATFQPANVPEPAALSLLGGGALLLGLRRKTFKK
jgi:hypothetical protein